MPTDSKHHLSHLERGSMPVVVRVADSTAKFLGLVTLKLNSFMDLALGLAPQNQHSTYLQTPAQCVWFQHLASSRAQSPELADSSRLFPALGNESFPQAPQETWSSPDSTCLCTSRGPLPMRSRDTWGACRERWVLASEETQRKAISSCLQTKLHWEHSLPRGHLVSCLEWGIHLVPVTWVLRTSTGLDKWILRNSQSYLFSFPWCTVRPGMQ